MSGGSHGGGMGPNSGDAAGPGNPGRSRSPRAGPAAEPARGQRPPPAPPVYSATGPALRAEGLRRGSLPMPPAGAVARSIAGLAPLGTPVAPPLIPASAWPGAAPSGSATAAVLAYQQSVQHAAAAAARAAGAAAAAVPGSLPPAAPTSPPGTSLAMLEAQVASLGALLLALQGIVLQLIAVVNLMRRGS